MHIYFDNASTTPLDPVVLDAMLPYMRDHFGNPSSIHFHGRKVRAAIEEARTKVASLLGASTAEIFFMSSATEANNMVLINSLKELEIQRIVSSPTEHHCVLHSLDFLAKNSSVEIINLTLNEKGQVDFDELDTILGESDKKTMVSLMHANNEIGTMINLAKVSQICSQYSAYFHSDTVQSVGKFPIDVQKTPIHFLSGSAHKFYGPKGVGFLYINNEIKIPSYLHGGGQERNMRPGTENVYGIIGLARALELAIENMEKRKHHILSLREAVKLGLNAIFDDIQYIGAQSGDFHYGILNVSFPKSVKTDLLMMNLDIAGISASAGSACTSGAQAQSHVLNAIKADEMRNSVRFSFSHLNTLEEVDILLHKLQSFLPKHQITA